MRIEVLSHAGANRRFPTKNPPIRTGGFFLKLANSRVSPSPCDRVDYAYYNKDETDYRSSVRVSPGANARWDG